MSSCTIKVERDGDLQEVNPKDLTNSELCHLLSELLIDSEFATSDECHDWALAREEAVRRLKQNGETQDDVGQFYDAKPVVNAAKLREALVEARKVIKAMGGYWATETLPIIDAALSSPPRNCDRFGGDIDKLREACARERGLNPEEDFPDVFPDWLLAPATEQEGGAE